MVAGSLFEQTQKALASGLGFKSNYPDIQKELVMQVCVLEIICHPSQEVKQYIRDNVPIGL